MGRRGRNAPGRVVNLHGRKHPNMYIKRFPVLAARGMKIVSWPLSSGVEISLKYMDAMGTPAPMPTPVMALAVYNSSKVLACHVKSQPTVKGRQSSKTAILRPNLKTE